MPAKMAAAFAHIEPVRLAGFLVARIRAVGKLLRLLPLGAGNSREQRREGVSAKESEASALSCRASRAPAGRNAPPGTETGTMQPATTRKSHIGRHAVDNARQLRETLK
jgi:hypothetical protein